MKPSHAAAKLFPEQTEILTRLFPHGAATKFAQAYLLTGPQHLMTTAWLTELARSFLCNEFPPCLNCKSCRMLNDLQHPDLHYLTTADSDAIKIDAIRQLQQQLPLSLTLAARKLVLISPADKMNIQAASALLKILEEPPLHATFVLVAEQSANLPITIVSRCQKFSLKDYSLQEAKSYLDVANYYPESSQRYQLAADYLSIITALNACVADAEDVCSYAKKLQDYALSDLLWLFYLITAQAINDKNMPLQQSSIGIWQQFLQSQNLDNLYAQLATINNCSKLVGNNIALNHALTIENLLLGYSNVG